MSFAMSYANEMTSPEVEIAGEAGGNFFADSKSRHADLKAMLDSNKDNLKLEAMKRIINMVAKGKDASDLFPAVVKNVAVKNHELKKLVYVYLTRYAEEQQDLALLSISTFQRALKDPNQLIRASALRVLSSIRVQMIVPIMMLAIKESMRDMSSYVRKTAAHAIPKLYSLDPELKDQLVEVIDHLLADKATLVVGSAVYAFEEVCPERFDLIHKHYRKLCHLLMDIDEWGQLISLSLLTRYARTQFSDPNEQEGTDGITSSKFYSDEEEEEESEESNESGDSSENDSQKGETKSKKQKPYVMDPDLRLLLKNSKPLLQSRNSAVVLCVAQLYYYLAPKTEVGLIARALIRLLRAPRETQWVVLTNIATISAKRVLETYLISQNMFEPFLKSFFVRSNDPTHIKLLKLEILTNLATQTNISVILREFQTYVATHDKEFAAATIDAIGRCASNIKEVTDVCLSGLVNLMSTKSETVVAQSVVVIKKLLQMQPSQHYEIIVTMAKLIDKITVPAARASIIWLIGEYCALVPKIAPDVLRRMAKSFINEDESVKLQVLNLAVKLFLTNPEQTQLLVHYVFLLSRYDQSYDLRDRARFLRAMIFPQKEHKLQRFAEKMFLTRKPAPIIESSFKDRDQFQLGTLSHYLNIEVPGYLGLPPFPDDAPDGTARNVTQFPTASLDPPSRLGTFGSKFSSTGSIVPPSVGGSGGGGPMFTIPPSISEQKGKKEKKEKGFYSSSEEEVESSEEGDDSDEESDEDDENESEEIESDVSEEEDAESSEAAEESDDSSSQSSEDEKIVEPVKKIKPVVKADTVGKISKGAVLMSSSIKKSAKSAPKNSNLLLDLAFDSSEQGTASSGVTMGAEPLMPVAPSLIPTSSSSDNILKLAKVTPVTEPETMPAQLISSEYKVLLNRLVGRGVTVDYRFTRTLNLFSNKACSIELRFTNLGQSPVESIKMDEKKLPNEFELFEFNEIATLSPGQSSLVTIGINFNDTTQAACFCLKIGSVSHSVEILAPVGEQLQPLKMSPDQFKSLQLKLSGMNETSGVLKLKSQLCNLSNPYELRQKIYEVANVVELEKLSNDKVIFAGQTLAGKIVILISIQRKGDDSSEDVKLVVNCEKMVFGSMLFKQIKSVISQ